MRQTFEVIKISADIRGFGSAFRPARALNITGSAGWSIGLMLEWPRPPA